MHKASYTIKKVICIDKVFFISSNLKFHICINQIDKSFLASVF